MLSTRAEDRSITRILEKAFSRSRDCNHLCAQISNTENKLSSYFFSFSFLRPLPRKRQNGHLSKTGGATVESRASYHQRQPRRRQRHIRRRNVATAGSIPPRQIIRRNTSRPSPALAKQQNNSPGGQVERLGLAAATFARRRVGRSSRRATARPEAQIRSTTPQRRGARVIRIQRCFHGERRSRCELRHDDRLLYSPVVGYTA